MEMGRSILEHMAKLSGEPLNWTIRLVRSPLMQSFRELRSPYLLMAGNVLKGMGAQAALTSRYAPAPAPRNA